MCDELTEKDNAAWLAKKGGTLSRRDFGLLSGGAVMTAAMAAPAKDAEIVREAVNIKTPDGTCDAVFFHPGKGKHPGFLMWPDIRGLRPAFEMMAKRLASSGFAVLVVNPFYRHQKAPVVSEGESFSDPEVRERLLPMARALSPETAAMDTKAFVDFLDGTDAVDDNQGIGVCGYCMGGPLSFRSAAARPDRIHAVGSFHGGGLVTDRPTSPHLLIEKTKAKFLVAIAENDHEREPETKDILIQTFDATGHQAEVEVYEDAMHGWCPPDSRVYHEAQAERAWSRLLHLLSSL